MRKFLYFGCCLAALTAPLSAQERAVSRERIVDEDGNVAGYIERELTRPLITVTATGTPIEIEDTGQAVTLVEREEIEAVQGPDIARILRRVPGVTLSRNGGPGAFTALRVRGAQGEQVLVLVDGARVADPAAPSGGFDFGTLLPGTIRSIDLLRGSNSVIWGSDAIGGVLSVSTRAETGVEASVEYGARDSLTGTLAGGVETDRGFVGAAAGYTRSDGFSAAASGTEADGFEQIALTARGTYYVTDTIDAFASVRYAAGELEIDGFPAPLFALADTAEYQETEQVSGSLGLSRDTGPLFLQARYSFADTTRDNFDPAFGTAPGFTSDGHSDRVDLRGEWRPIGPVIVAFGGEGEWTSYETLFDPGEDTSILGAYAQAGIEFGAISGHIGLRHDDHAIFGGATSFGADVSYEVANDVRLRASLGEGFKAPSLFQLFSDFGNRALSPETSTGFDLGLAWKDRTAPFHAGVTVFRRDSEDLIDFVSCFGVTGGICADRPFGTYDNVDRARAQGLELEAGARLGPLQLRGVYAFIDTEDRTSGAPTQGNRLARRPRHAATVSGDLDLGAPLLGFELRYVSSAFDDAFNSVRLDDHLLLDLRAELEVGALASGAPLILFGRVENVTDTDYQTAAGYAQPGRGVFAGVRATF